MSGLRRRRAPPSVTSATDLAGRFLSLELQVSAPSFAARVRVDGWHPATDGSVGPWTRLRVAGNGGARCTPGSRLPGSKGMRAVGPRGRCYGCSSLGSVAPDSAGIAPAFPAAISAKLARCGASGR